MAASGYLVFLLEFLFIICRRTLDRGYIMLFSALNSTLLIKPAVPLFTPCIIASTIVATSTSPELPSGKDCKLSSLIGSTLNLPEIRVFLRGYQLTFFSIMAPIAMDKNNYVRRETIFTTHCSRLSIFMGWLRQ